ncbi:MAG: phosphatidylglycerol lysyltransferase domain-containing protein [Patescibacteria group bacterium]|jgi:hypothetical protein
MSTTWDTPRFKKLDISDREFFLGFFKGQRCFSDFHFTSLWVYNTDDTAEVATINGNLVLKFHDYITGDPFYTFFGKEKVEDTIRILFELSKRNKMEPVLKLVPEDNFGEGLEEVSNKYKVELDRDNFDYIFSISNLATLGGKDFETQRNMINRFRRRIGEHSTKVLDLGDSTIQKKIMDLFNVWMHNKSGKGADAEHEAIAIRRMLDYSEHLPGLIALGVFLEEELLAFSVNEVVDSDVAIAHFRKCNIKYPGIFQLLEYESAKELSRRGCKFLNYEQDLGIEGLRKAKDSWRPIEFLKKHTITEK